MSMWHVAVAKPNTVIEKPKQNTALPPQGLTERLEAQGAEVFYPKARITRQRVGKRLPGPIRETAWVPIFGNYIFVRAEPRLIWATRGIAKVLLDTDGKPGVIPDAEIAQMQLKYRNYKMALKREEMPLKRGQVVRIMEGPFTGFSAQVQLVDMAKGLLKVMADVMGRETQISIPVQDVMAS